MPMIAAVVLLSALQRNPFMLPAGSSSEVARAYAAIAAETKRGDYRAAKAKLRLLPSRSISVEWDDRIVPEGSRFDYAKQRDAAFREWAGAVQSGTQFSVVKSGGDLRFVFAPEGSPDLAWSETPGQPRLTLKIGFAKPGSKSPLDPAAIHNAVSFAAGTYLGVSKLPIPGYVMAGPDESSSMPLRPSSILETPIAVRVLQVRSAVEDAVANSRPIPDGVPAVEKPPQGLRAGPVLQGEKFFLEFPIVNSGGGDLDFRLIPDCSCFTRTAGSIRPGQATTARARMDTTEFPGPVNKKLYLFTNDPKMPVAEIPVEVDIKRRFRMLPPIQTLVAESDTATLTAYLYGPDDHPIGVKGVTIQGLPAEVSYEPWKGELADPDLKEGLLTRTGYRFAITIKDIQPGSRMGTNIVVETDDPNIPQLMYPVYFQRGILALPSQIFLGEIGQAPRKAYFILSRPGRPFKILSLSADSKNVSVSSEPTKTPGEFRVDVAYDGKASKGDYHATISVRTDDSKQPLIEVPVVANVR